MLWNQQMLRYKHASGSGSLPPWQTTGRKQEKSTLWRGYHSPWRWPACCRCSSYQAAFLKGITACLVRSVALQLERQIRSGVSYLEKIHGTPLVGVSKMLPADQTWVGAGNRGDPGQDLSLKQGKCKNGIHPARCNDWWPFLYFILCPKCCT